MMRTFLLLTGGLLANISVSQVLTPQPIPCVLLNQNTIDNFYNDGVIHTVDCIETIAPFDFDPAVNYTLKAGESIHLDGEISITPDNAQQFHAYIEKPGFDLAWYAPQTSGEVGQFEKLEIGLQFEDFINDHILDYVNTPHLDPSLPPDALNPYNPEDIDVYAEIYHEESPGVYFGPYKVNGFFYKEYQRNTTDWTELSVPHNFRFRYTPRELGTYKVAVTAVVNGHGTFHSDPFYFQCVPSSDPHATDFVRVGDNKRYFRIGDAPFFPVGQNLTGPNNSVHLAEFDPHPVIASDYVDFHQLMDTLKEKGGNYFRYIVSPWQSEIEFEHLNNYTNRLSNAWEFDKILDKAHELDLRMHYNMAIHYSFERPAGYAMVNWDWERYEDEFSTYPNECFIWGNHKGYCYREELNMEDPMDFLSDPQAMKHYKNRLRYMVARWGYSTNIAVMELLSEANNFGNQHELKYECEGINCGCKDNSDYAVQTNPVKPYKDTTLNPLCPTCVPLFQWQHEMCRFIKQDLEHDRHPMAVSYTGQPKWQLGDMTYFSEFVDIATYNNYYLRVEKAEFDYGAIEKTYHNPDSVQYINKPMMYSEYGSGLPGLELCDNRTGFIKALYFTPFVGLAGSAMNWDHHWNEFNSWQYLEPIKNLMEGIKLDEENWQPGEPIVPVNTNDEPIEVYYLVSEQSSTNAPRKAVGVICNRTYNWFTQSTGPTCDSHIPSEDKYLIANGYWYGAIQHLDLKIPDMGTTKDYKINWYNALNGNFISTTDASTGLFENLELEYPGILTGNNASLVDDECPIYFFEVYPEGSTFKSHENQTNLYEKEQRESHLKIEDLSAKDQKIQIKPNPFQDNIEITCPEKMVKNGVWRITDLQGNLIRKGNIEKRKWSENLNNLQSGVYIVTFQTNYDVKSFRIIKT